MKMKPGIFMGRGAWVSAGVAGAAVLLMAAQLEAGISISYSTSSGHGHRGHDRDRFSISYSDHGRGHYRDRHYDRRYVRSYPVYYSHRVYQPRYTRVVYRPTVYVAPRPVYTDRVVYAASQSYLDGWDYLSNGQGYEALKYFSAKSSEFPGNGQYKVGYSLAAAMNGDYDTAVYAMRRAFQYDADGAGYLPLTPELEKQLYYLAGHYRQASYNAYDTDAAFMLAAISHLLQDYESAHLAINQALANGDHSASTVRLKRVVTEHLYG